MCEISIEVKHFNAPVKNHVMGTECSHIYHGKYFNSFSLLSIVQFQGKERKNKSILFVFVFWFIRIYFAVNKLQITQLKNKLYLSVPICSSLTITSALTILKIIIKLLIDDTTLLFSTFMLF